ncbi:MAG TPA: serine/threonine-protein kinase [Thermoanaerobaculia bacterium]|jgi:serine/threonine-protein kinase|nr:serine/threonine-protein kinase [Thermoanaerobaculia bacterium]
MALQAGETLGRYQLEQLIGQGGMAIVYRARDSVLGRTVAVKVIRPAYSEEPHFLDRFLQEARLVASLDHPNILPLFDFGEEKGRPYLVLPYLPGGSLADRMGGQPQPLPLVAAWTIQLAGALDAAHARGVLHRDVKPGNVLVTKDGRLMLGDFGIARLAEATTRLTATGMVVGTPIYMAPELARGADASPASDRYALAVMLFEMIAGQPPFLGSNPLSVLHQQVHEPVPSLAERLVEPPPALDAFLARALAKEPADRHRTARAMAEELVALLSPEQRSELSTLVWSGGADAGTGAAEAPTVVNSGGTMRLPPRGTSPPPLRRTGAAAPPVVTSAVTAETPRQRRGSLLVWGLLAAAAIAAVVLLVPRGWLIRGSGAAPAAAAPTSVTGSTSAAPGGPSSVEPASAPAVANAASTAAPSAAPTAQTAASPSAPSSGATETAPPSETREVTPMEPPALGLPAAPGVLPRTAISALRRPTHRPTAAELQQIVDTTSAAAAIEPGRREPLTAAQAWAQGGLAYLAGRRDEAADRRQQLSTHLAAWGTAWPAATFNGSTAWDTAALYADPRRELDNLLLPEMRGLGSNLRAALAAAYSAHLDGDHAGALRLLLDDAKIDPAASDAPHRALAAQFLVAEAIEAHDEAAARKWLPDALDGGRAPLVRAFLVEMAALTTETNGVVAVAALKDEVCRLVPEYCGGLGRSLQQQPQPMNQDRFGRRRRFGGGGFGGPRPRPTGG